MPRLTADAVAQCLQHEDLKVRARALEALSHQGRHAQGHVAAVAALLEVPQLRGHAAMCLSWLGEPGAHYAAQLLALERVPAARSAFWAMCQAEQADVRAAAVRSLIERLRCPELGDVECLGQ